MGETKFNFAFVFSMVILLIFSYITFLGLSYWTGGSLTTPILLTITLIAVVAGCVYVMSMSRSTRWTDLGLIGQICFGVIVLAALLCASLPFTNFLRVANEKQQLSQLMYEAAESAENMDSAYNAYAEKRLKDYRNNLYMISNAKKTDPAKYAEAISKASGDTDAQKIDALVESLRTKLMPEKAEEIINERHSWLDNAAHLNVWNPMTPANVNKIRTQMTGWYDNYRSIASVTYFGETPSEFKYDNFDIKLNTLTDSYKEFKRPSGIAVLVSILCFGFMLLPYFLAQGSLAASKSGNKDSQIYE